MIGPVLLVAASGKYGWDVALISSSAVLALGRTFSRFGSRCVDCPLFSTLILLSSASNIRLSASTFCWVLEMLELFQCLFRPCLASIHDRCDQVLQCMRENKCSMACAFRLASCPRSTLRDFVAIAELKKVDSRELDLVLRDQVGSVRALEVVCRKRLRRYIPVMNNMRREGQLLPLKFDPRFYE